jgi:hypothetical protein
MGTTAFLLGTSIPTNTLSGHRFHSPLQILHSPRVHDSYITRLTLLDYLLLNRQTVKMSSVQHIATLQRALNLLERLKQQFPAHASQGKFQFPWFMVRNADDCFRARSPPRAKTRRQPGSQKRSSHFRRILPRRLPTFSMEGVSGGILGDFGIYRSFICYVYM